ncbi:MULTISPECIES: glycosyltransferase [Bacteroides]|uniref:glycosyltransferase n=1 Tax=Bacteroides TaxID=816 RepID=UPI0018A000DD|nr:MULTISPECIES: glycosyltransferase [Bacteroides]MDC2612103.1 glycosyltransferase [Bacteroides ovatus]MDC2632747.1 glycosyltransferase [Bacteroides ovatus]
MIKNIAFLHKNFPYGGAERITIDIAEYASHHEYKSIVFTWNQFQDKLSDNTRKYITIIELPDKKEQHSTNNAQFILEKIKEYNIRIFIIQGDELPYLPLLKKEALSCKFIFSFHGKPFCEATYIEISETERHTANRPLLKRLEWKYIRNIKFRITKKYKKIVLNSYINTYSQVDAFLVLCEEYKDQFIKELKLDKSNNKLFVIHNPERIVNQPNLDKKKQLIFVGRMTYPDKRIDRLIHIWDKIYKQVPDWELLLVGEGPEKKKLEKTVTQLGSQHIYFMGHSTNVDEFYKNAAILCLTSTTEGWPLCLTEAQANGVIPIAYGCSDGVKTILSPSGINGFIIPPFKSREYAKTLIKLLKNIQLQKTMQKNVITKSKEYSIDNIGRKWIQLFDKLTQINF